MLTRRKVHILHGKQIETNQTPPFIVTDSNRDATEMTGPFTQSLVDCWSGGGD